MLMILVGSDGPVRHNRAIVRERKVVCDVRCAALFFSSVRLIFSFYRTITQFLNLYSNT